MQVQSCARSEGPRVAIGRVALAFSLVLFVAGLALPAAAGEPTHANIMCTDVPTGAPGAEVNGAVANFTWTEAGVSWTVTGADPSHFRVYVHSSPGTDVVWGTTGSWSGSDLRSVAACHCPETSGPTTTTKPEKPKTTTTTEPVKPTTTTTMVNSTTGPTTTTTAAAPTTTGAPTTTATVGAAVSPTTVVAPSSSTSTTTPGASVATASPATSTTPKVAVLPQQVVRAHELPATGISSSLLALVGSALVGMGGLALSGGRRFRH